MGEGLLPKVMICYWGSEERDAAVMGQWKIERTELEEAGLFFHAFILKVPAVRRHRFESCST